MAPATAIPSSRKTHSNHAAAVAKRARSQKGHTNHEGPSKLEFPKSSHANRLGAANRMPKICFSHLDDGLVRADVVRYWLVEKGETREEERCR